MTNAALLACAASLLMTQVPNKKVQIIYTTPQIITKINKELIKKKKAVRRNAGAFFYPGLIVLPVNASKELTAHEFAHFILWAKGDKWYGPIAEAKAEYVERNVDIFCPDK